MFVCKLQQPAEGQIIKESWGVAISVSSYSRMDLYDAIDDLKAMVGGKLYAQEEAVKRALRDALGELMEKAESLSGGEANALMSFSEAIDLEKDKVTVVMSADVVRLSEDEE